MKWDFKLDEFQKKAISAVKQGQSVLVSAPTGAGKTVIAEYVIKKCIEEGKGVIYTAPIKALSNQKYREFKNLFPGQTGIVTGDVSIQPHASLLIMTTEIFRNRLLESSPGLSDHSWIIFDEIHYIDDMERGTVWEESLILLPPDLKVLGLSATIPNIDNLASWLQAIHGRPFAVIKENHRPVPLNFFYQSSEKVTADLKELKRFGFANKHRVNLPLPSPGQRRFRGPRNRAMPLIKHLIESRRLPCLYFCFSRNLLESDRMATILSVFDSLTHRFHIGADERTQVMRGLVKNGIAYHHAGIHPMLKEVIERLFTSRLIRVIFTTETFALGINMPARTVVIDELRKRYGRFFRIMKKRDFFQMAGRSGRRGIDKEGFVYLRVNPLEVDFDQLNRFLRAKPEPIQSRFNLSYAALLNLYELYGENLHQVFLNSFYYFKEGKKSNLYQYEQMKRRLKLLRRLNYLSSNKLTDKGQFAKGIYGYELSLGEIYGNGLLERLSYRELAMLCLAAVFEPRPGKKKIRGNKTIKKLRMTCSRITSSIHQIEKRDGISSITKKFYFDLSTSLLNWMDKKPFREILAELESDEGEIIRYYRMCIQVLREMSLAPLGKNFRQNIYKAIDLINRGVINAEEQLEQVAAVDFAEREVIHVPE